MQYRLAGSDWPETPDVYHPYSSGYAGASPEDAGSAVELADGRILYVWSQMNANNDERRNLCCGYADSALDFFTADNTVTFDRILVQVTGTATGMREPVGRVFPDPFYGTARLWLSFYGGNAPGWVYDASVETLGSNTGSAPYRVHALYTSIDQGDTWQWNVNLFEAFGTGSPFAGASSIQVGQFESLDVWANWAVPFPNVAGVPVNDPAFPFTSYGGLITTYTGINDRSGSAKYGQSRTAKSADGGQTWSLQVDPHMKSDVGEPLLWDPYTLPTVVPDTGWLDRQHIPSDLASFDVGERGGNTVSTGNFMAQTDGGSAGGRQGFWITTGGSVWEPHTDYSGFNVTLDRTNVSGRVGSMFTMHGEPGVFYHFVKRNGDTRLGRSIVPFSQFNSDDVDYIAIPSSEDPTHGAGELVWSGLTQGQTDQPVYVQKVGDYMGFFFDGNVIGVGLFTPRCQPLPPFHAPHKAWFNSPATPVRGSRDAVSRRKQYEANWKRVETWSNLVRRNGNTLDLLNMPRANHRSPAAKQENRWLTLERWTRTLCNDTPLHIPYKSTPSRDETNWLAFERWISGLAYATPIIAPTTGAILLQSGDTLALETGDILAWEV